MDSAPIFPGMGQQLSIVMHALEAELNMEPIWTLKQTKHKIFLDIQWTKTKTPATTSNVTKPASCATTTQLLKEAVSAAKPALNTETSAKPDSDKKRKQKKKSPSTRRHDKQRQERWLSQKRRGSNHGRKASSEDSSPSTVGLGTGSKAGTASPCNHNQDPGTVGNAREESPALSQLPVSRDEEQHPPVADGLSATEANKGYELLNCDHHKHLMKKFKKGPSQCRPDIAHQCLLMLFDSPLNRAGLLQVFLHTEKNVLIQISPQTRIPRTFDRFSGLMMQLLHKLSISASGGPQKLLKVIKNPISDHLSVGCRKICMSYSADKCVHPRELPVGEDPIVIVIGAMAHGKVDVDYTEEDISISNYPLSAALTCTEVCSAFEDAWGIL